MLRHFVIVIKLFSYLCSRITNRFNMIREFLLSSVLAAMALSASSQGYNLSENERRYIVTTKQPEPEKAQQSEDGVLPEEAEPVDSMSLWFQYVSLCDWVPGMRFMVIPDKKDLIIKSFAEANTGNLINSATLRHKVMVYTGHDNANGGLHEHINFKCEETGQSYYFEVPTARFDDYCYTKAGVPSLVYLGDVDTAQDKLLGKTLLTKGDVYYIDTPLSVDGYQAVFDVPVGTEVKVVAVGAGSRSFPVKIIVKEVTNNGKGREFYQNVAISRTNCGLRDEEFDISNMKVHTFDGSFELADDNVSVGGIYERYAHKDVYTLVPSDFVDVATKNKVHLGRLSVFNVKNIRSQRGSEYAKMTLYERSTGKMYTKDVLFTNKNKIGIADSQHDDFVGNIFAIGNPQVMDGVRASTLQDLRNGVVRSGFSEAETRLALGEPTRTGLSGNGYTWVYNEPGKPRTKVHFNRKTNKVVRVDR